MESIISSVVVSALVSGVISIVGKLISGRDAKRAIHDERRYKKTNEAYEVFLANIKKIDEDVIGERDKKEDPILQNLDQYDIADSFEIVDFFFAHVSMCKRLNLKMDEIESTLEKTAYLLDEEYYESLKNSHVSLFDEIKGKPFLFHLSFDFDELIALDVRYVDIPLEHIDKAKEYLDRVEKLVEKFNQILVETLRDLCR